MKVAILEWICGGGIAAGEHAPQLADLQREGWAMLGCLADDLVRAGHAVSLALDERLEEHAQFQLLRADLVQPVAIELVQASTNQRIVPQAWERLAHECELAIVIAPESDRILEGAIGALQTCSASLVNCHGVCLRRSADKLTTSQACAATSIPHPPTRLVSQASKAWLNSVVNELMNDYWILKPQYGAGADGVQIVSLDAIDERLDAHGEFIPNAVPLTDRLIVQPWISGSAFSRSAIVGRNGKWQWLPLVTQRFQRQQSEGLTELKYDGGAIAAPLLQDQFPVSLLKKLESTFGDGAKGWISFDFVFSERLQQWVMIEVNPRCTTSLVGLSASYSGNLAEVLIQSQMSDTHELNGTWNPLSFAADGCITD